MLAGMMKLLAKLFPGSVRREGKVSGTTAAGTTHSLADTLKLAGSGESFSSLSHLEQATKSLAPRNPIDSLPPGPFSTR